LAPACNCAAVGAGNEVSITSAAGAGGAAAARTASGAKANSKAANSAIWRAATGMVGMNGDPSRFFAARDKQRQFAATHGMNTGGSTSNPARAARALARVGAS